MSIQEAAAQVVEDIQSVDALANFIGLVIEGHAKELKTEELTGVLQALSLLQLSESDELLDAYNTIDDLEDQIDAQKLRIEELLGGGGDKPESCFSCGTSDPENHGELCNPEKTVGDLDLDAEVPEPSPFGGTEASEEDTPEGQV